MGLLNKRPAVDQPKPTGGAGPGVIRSISLIALGAGFYQLAHQATFPTLPIYMALRGASEQEIAFVIGMMGVLAIGSRPFSGWLIDSWGRRKFQTASLFTLAGIAVSYVFSTTLLQFSLLRGLQSAATGGANTAVNTYVSDVAPSTRRAEFLGYVNAAQTVAMALGPTLGFALLSVPAVGFLSIPWFDSIAALGGYNFAALFLFIVVVTVVGAVMTVFVPESARAGASRRLSWKHLFYKPAAKPMLLTTCLIAPHAAVISYMPFYAGERGLGNAGLYFSFQALGILTAGLTLGRVADRYGRRLVVSISLAGVAVAMVMVASAYGFWWLLLAGFLTGICQGGARNSMAAWTADHAPPAERGAALSTANMGFDVGITLGATVLGFVVPALGVSNGFIVIAIAPLMGALFAFFFLKDHRPVLT